MDIRVLISRPRQNQGMIKIKRIIQRMLGKKKAIALPMAIIFVLLAGIMAAGFLQFISSECHMAEKRKDYIKAFYAAEAGAEKGVYEVKTLYATAYPTDAQLLAILAPTISGYSFSPFTISRGTSSQGTITSGLYAGLEGTTATITVSSQANSTGPDQAQAKVIQQIQSQYIGVFQFGVFYKNDLEILPGPDMNFAGRVHTNGNLYAGCNGNLDFDSNVTAKNIYHDRKDDPGNVSNGQVRFIDGDGVKQEMKQGSVWLDSSQSDWATESQNRWDGRVKTQEHGVTDLTLPLPTGYNPHDIIERGNAGDPAELANAKYYNKAKKANGGLRIIDGNVINDDGTPDTIATNDLITKGVITTKTFYDYREGVNITVREVDVAALRTSGKSPANGMLYVSESGTHKGVRVTNGTELPSSGLTVASDNPVYIKGDYNTTNKKKSSVVGDAVYILSSNWDDTKGDKSLDKRKATPGGTTVNTAIMAGNTETSVGAYNGGLENFPRFLEDWDGRTLTYSGSLICLWNSEQATGQWYCGGDYYKPPHRHWGYDTMYGDPAKAPPGAPFIMIIQPTSWSQL